MRPRSRPCSSGWSTGRRTPTSPASDPDALAQLPEIERADWQKLWADVAALLAKTKE